MLPSNTLRRSHAMSPPKAGAQVGRGAGQEAGDGGMPPLCTVWEKFQEPLPLSLPSSPSSSNSVFALAPTLLSPALSKWSNTCSAPDGQGAP